MTSFFFARVNETLMRRQSRSKSPTCRLRQMRQLVIVSRTLPALLDRTNEIKIQSLSRPWLLSAVRISISGNVGLRRLLKSLICCR